MNEAIIRICSGCGGRVAVGMKCAFCERYDAICNQYAELEGPDRFEPDPKEGSAGDE